MNNTPITPNSSEEWVKTAERTMDYQAGVITELGVRAEAAEAKLAELENNSLIDHLEKCSAIVASWPEWKKQGAHASKFTRPAPAETIGWLAPKNVSYLVAPGEPSSLWAMGFNACIDTILRNIEEENKK